LPLPLPTKEFGDIAHKLARNPLGIIALFIVLVYAIAALVTGAVSLTPAERLPLVYFLVAFPPIVLVAFYRLVAKHHTKLYSPQDFLDKDGFFRALTPEEKRQRFEEAVQEVDAPPSPTPLPAVSTPKLGDDELVRSLPPAEMQERQLAAAIDAPLRARYYIAENLAMQELEAQLGIPIKRNIAYADWGFDGLFVKDSRPVIVEIKLLTTRSWRNSMNKVLASFSSSKNGIRPTPSFVFVGVTDDMSSEESGQVATELAKGFREAGLDVEIRLFDFRVLRTKYGVASKRAG
jgi:hypothetical protein